MLHKDKVVLVTGAATGIGRAAAIAFAREGGRVAVADYVVEDGQQTVDAIKSAGGEAIFIQADMRDAASVEKMVAATVGHFGALNVAFNNAGIRGSVTNLVDCDEDGWDTVMDTNLKGVWLCMKYEIPEMLKCGGGAIVNTASGMANFAGAKFAAYATSKHGVQGLTRSAAVDFGPQGIRVNALLPGATDTQQLRATVQHSQQQASVNMDRIPLRRFSAPEEQAEAAIWLASDKASFVTGASLICDGGASALR